MQIQTNQLELIPFEVVYNARSHKASRSRKSSVSIIEKDKIKHKTKKLRKMTLNPESVRFQQIKMIEKHNQRISVKSLKEQSIQQEVKQFDFSIFLELGPKTLNLAQEQPQFEIICGVSSDLQLDNDFKQAWNKQPTGIEGVECNQQS